MPPLCLSPSYFFHIIMAYMKDEMRQTTFGRVLARAERRHRAVRLNALQRWRLCAATAAMEALLKRQCREKVQRGFVLLEAFLRRQGRARLVTGFQRWRKTDSEVTALTELCLYSNQIDGTEPSIAEYFAPARLDR